MNFAPALTGTTALASVMSLISIIIIISIILKVIIIGSIEDSARCVAGKECSAKFTGF